MDSGFPWWILLVVVFFGIFVYLMLMLFVPEWVGITGKTALENEKSHREGSDAFEPTPKGRMRTMGPLPRAPEGAPTNGINTVSEMTGVTPASAESRGATTNGSAATQAPTLKLVKKSEKPSESED